MNKLIVLGAVVVIGVLVALSYVSAYNYGNRAEAGITATWENNENILAQYGQKITEAAQITEMQRDDVAAILTGGLDARYGSDGSQAAFQWIQEQNPNVGPEVYVKLQDLIEAGRNEFKVAQTRLIDEKRQYRTELGYLWRGTMLSLAGYPNLKVGYPHGTEDEYETISTARANDAFETGIEQPINLRD